MTDNPSRGLADVVAASSALSDIDGSLGRLSYRGYDIHDLAGAATFEEVAYLLQRGAPPSGGELAGYRAELTAGQLLPELVTAGLAGIAASQAPMEALRTLVSLSSASDPARDSNEPAANQRKAARLTAAQPVLVAAYHAARRRVPLADPDPGLGLAGNLLLQVTGRAPAERAARMLDTCWCCTRITP
jgi:citrate synthase